MRDLAWSWFHLVCYFDLCCIHSVRVCARIQQQENKPVGMQGLTSLEEATAGSNPP